MRHPTRDEPRRMIRERLRLFVATAASALGLFYLLVGGHIFQSTPVAPWVITPATAILGILTIPLWALAMPAWSRISRQSIRYALIIPIAALLVILAIALPVGALIALALLE